MSSESSRLHHLLISASAGSGKTYQLVRRYLHLLALGQPAESIVAVTFTRKAAGEFFSRILQRLAELAADPQRAAEFFRGLEPPVAADGDYRALLRRLTRRMHRLRLGTMDSFFANVAACFAMELGLPAGARVMDEAETRQAGREALDRLLERLYGDGSEAAGQTLVEAYKQATFGAEEKTVDQALQDWLHRGLVLWEDSAVENGVARGWGDLARIWPQAWELTPLEDAVAELRASFKPAQAKGQEMLEELCRQALETVPGLALPKRVAFFLEKLPEVWRDLQAGDAVLAWGRKEPVTGAAARAMVRLARLLMAREFLARAQRTRGQAALLGLLAEEYARSVRSRGRLAFADVQRLLARAAGERSPWAGGGDELWFRLDARQDHWLLDEFQDTSRVQWRVIGQLVDEVLQDEGGRRSFFAVGDPKQSIYLWREAEPDLFDDILRGYPEDGFRGLHREGLSQSFRSAQPVLDAVNAVFGDAAALRALLPEGALNGFAFEAHVAARARLSGCAALLSPGVAAGDEVASPADLVAGLLLEIQPLRRGLSCAVLVRSNSEARRITEELRAATGLEVVCESDLHPCTDNAVGLALLSLLSLAAHPHDRLALEHLRMTPLWTELEPPDGSWQESVAELRRRVFERGFAAFLEDWTPRLRRCHPGLDRFHQRRLGQMADIAAEFDATGSRDLDAFLEFAREYPLRQRGATGAVQVMTVHASKGLEFDLVFLPTLDGASMDQPRHDQLLIRREAGGIRWVLETPPKVCAELDPVLSAELEEMRRRTAFESLCRLYVAMTRAKRGLYLVAAPPPKNGTALKESRLLRERLPAQPVREDASWRIEWQTGDWRWYEEAPEREPAALAAPAPLPPLGPLLRATQPLPRRRTPSGEESFKVPGRVLFGAGREPGRRLGTRVHELFAAVLWREPREALQQRWLELGLVTPADLQPAASGPEADALRLVRRVLDSPAGEEAFTPPAGRVEVWRERSFDFVQAGDWVSGTFDRVVLECDAQGRAMRGWILDFKTDEVPDEAALAAKLDGYQPQIALYVQALSGLTGLPVGAIRASLLLVRSQRIVDLLPR